MKILDFIIAEDVRKERGNTHSIIGVYNEKVSLGLPSEAPWPRPFKMSMFIRIEKKDATVWPDRLKINVFHNDKLIEPPIEGPVGKKTESRFLTIVVNMFPGLPLPGPGILTVSLDLFSDGTSIFSGNAPFPISFS